MKYMVIESFKAGKKDQVYARYQEHGRMLPSGLQYLDSWLSADHTKCFQLMEATAPEVFPAWTAKWDDLVDFEIAEVIDSPTKVACRGGTTDSIRFPQSEINIIPCDESYSEQILAILNEAILNSTALYDYRLRPLESMTAWFAAKRKGNYPVIGAVSPDGELLGFASYGVFRGWPAYKYSVEHSVYVATTHRGKGIGKRLLQRLIEEAEAQNYHVLVGGIDSQNTVSIVLHRALGFQHAGTIHQVGFKFGRWLDLDFYQLVLKTPASPVDG